MRKLKAYGAAALLAVSAAAGGVSYAQDATAEAPAPDTALAVPQFVAKTWLGIAVDADLTITRIATGSPAETAQLQVGDVITAVDGTSIASADDLRAIVEAAAAGDVLTLTLERDAAEVSADVTLAERQGRGGMGGRHGGMFADDPLHVAQMTLGVTLEAVDGGYQVTAVDENAALELEVGDVITAVNGEAVDTLDWHTLVMPTDEDNTITLTVERGSEAVTLTGEPAMFGRQPFGNPPGNGQRGGGRGGNGPNGQGNPPNGNNGQPPMDGQPPTDGSTV